MEFSLEFLKDVKKQMEDEINQLSLKRESLNGQIQSLQEELNRKQAESNLSLNVLKDEFEREKELAVQNVNKEREILDDLASVLATREEQVSHLEDERTKLHEAQKLHDENVKQLNMERASLTVKLEVYEKDSSELSLKLEEVSKQKEELSLLQTEVATNIKDYEALLSDLTIQKQALDSQTVDFSEVKADLATQAEEARKRQLEQDDRESALKRQSIELDSLHTSFLQKSEDLQAEWQKLNTERFKLANEAALIAHQKGLTVNG